MLRLAAAHPNPLRTSLLRASLMLALSLILALTSFPSRAQEEASPAPDEAQPPDRRGEPAPPSDVEVIRIKGRAVSGIQTDVPQSATEFSAAEIEALGAQDIGDLAKVTPNVEIRTAGATAPTFFIRGVGLSDFSSNAAGAVAIYQDDVAINGPAIQLSTLFDVENVVVLRGPVSTGSGRNASAGAIKVYSRKPTGDLSADLRTTFGRFNQREFEGALELPLIEEALATRLSFRLTERDGYGTNGCGGAPPPEDRTGKVCGEARGTEIPTNLPTRVNDLGNWAARGMLRLVPPGTEMDWLLILHGGRTDQLSTLGQAIGASGDPKVLKPKTGTGYQEPDILDMQRSGLKGEELSQVLAKDLDIRPYRGDYNRVGDTRLDAWGATLQGEIPLGSLLLRSVSAYDSYDRFRDQDQDFTPDVAFEAVSRDEGWQVFQEISLTGEAADTPFDWNLGGFYLMEDLTTTVDSFFNVQNPCRLGELAGACRNYAQKNHSFAFYGSFEWGFLDDFWLEGGVRYNWDRKDFDHLIERTGANPPPIDDTLTEHAPTGTLALNYRLFEDTTLYWKYSRGWKPGTFNSTAQQNRSAQPAFSETIDAWETGLKGIWLDGRLSLGAALFYYRYEDYQVFNIENEASGPPTLQIINANDAEVYGAELDLRAEPLAGWAPPLLENLVVTGRFGWLESQFLDFTNRVVRQLGVGPASVVEVDYSGNPLINSPRFKASMAFEWSFDLDRWGVVIPRYDFSWTDDISFGPNGSFGSPGIRGNTGLPEHTVGQAAFWLHNLRLTYRAPSGNFEIGGWVRNLTEEVYKTFAFDASIFSEEVINFVGEPRTYGIDFSVRF